MRTLLKATLDVQASNKAILDGSLGQVIGSVMQLIQPEASYFLTENGKRTAYFFFDMTDTTQIPQIAEPLFMNFNAEISFTPVMNEKELGRGIEEAMAAQG